MGSYIVGPRPISAASPPALPLLPVRRSSCFRPLRYRHRFRSRRPPPRRIPLFLRSPLYVSRCPLSSGSPTLLPTMVAYNPPGTLADVHAYVTGVTAAATQAPSTLRLHVTHANMAGTTFAEVRLSRNDTPPTLRDRLYRVTGTRPAAMELALMPPAGAAGAAAPAIPLTDDAAPLGAVAPAVTDGWTPPSSSPRSDPSRSSRGGKSPTATLRARTSPPWPASHGRSSPRRRPSPRRRATSGDRGQPSRPPRGAGSRGGPALLLPFPRQG